MKVNLVNDSTRFCPECKADWQGSPIPEKNQQYYGTHTHFSRLVGIELGYDHPKRYDGVSYWACPDCSATWNRFTGKREDIPENKP